MDRFLWFFWRRFCFIEKGIFVLHRHIIFKYFFERLFLVFVWIQNNSNRQIISIYINLANVGDLEVWEGIGLNFFDIAVGWWNLYQEIDKYRSCHYKFVCCNLDAYGKTVASWPGVKPLSSWVKTSKWFQGMSTLPMSFWFFLVKRSLLENADKS